MISSESNGQIKEIIKLQKTPRERKKKGLFVVEGIKLTKEAADYGKLQKAYISQRVWEEDEGALKELAQSVPYEIVEGSVFQSMSDTVTPQGVMGVVKIPVYSMEEILDKPQKSILLLDDLRDPGNLGTIMRTAEGAGMSGVILSRESVDLFNPKVVRATMGAIFRVPYCYTEDLGQVIDRLKSNSIPVYGTMMEGSQIYDRIDYRQGVGMVIGNEANGISDKVKRHMTGGVRIPMEGKLESLNAAVAAAILMYEVARQRR